MPASRRFIIVILLLGFFFAGCAPALGPLRSPDFERHVQAALPAGHSPVLYANAAEWYPPARAIITGVLVCTERSVYFLVWSEEEARYLPRLRVAYEEISLVTRKKYGLVSSLVIQDKNLAVHSFNALKAGGAWVDNDRTATAYAIVADRIRPAP